MENKKRKTASKSKNGSSIEVINNDNSNEIKGNGEIPESQNGWFYKDSVLIRRFGSDKGSDKISAFDLDDTLICPKSKEKFSTSDNWKLLFGDKTTDKLKEISNKGFRIVILSNQKGFTTGDSDINDWKKKIDLLSASLDIPFTILASTTTDFYRKPSPGLWNVLCKQVNDGIKVTQKDCYYVGDAAGRPKVGSTNKDFSDSDYKFSLNAKLQFFTPEVFFLNDNSRKVPPVDNSHLLKPQKSLFSNADDSKLTSTKQEVIIFVGSAASGKTSFYHKNLASKGYAHVNQDKLGNFNNVKKALKEFLAKGSSVVVDATHREKARRKEVIEIAQSCGVTNVRCFFFNFPKDFALHMNTVRACNPFRKTFSNKVPDMIIHAFYKNLERPEISEGISEILTMNFTGQFDSPEDEEFFYYYL